MKIGRQGPYYKILKDDGTPVILTCAEAGILVNFIGKEGLRSQINDRLSDADGDWLDLSLLEETRDELIDEIFSEFEDEIDYGNSVSDDQIDDSIAEFASLYGLYKEE